MTPLAAWLASLCRLYILVALVAAVAGKAADLGFFKETLAEMFRLRDRAAGAAALALVGAEAAIAVALVAAPGPGMIAALALFASFWLVILVALALRRPLVCNCFGGRARPISGLDLVRNGFLIAACAWFLIAPPAAVIAPAVWLLLAGLALVLFLILRLAARLRAAEVPPTTVPLGEKVPPFGGRARADGRPIGSEYLAGRPLVLVFLSPGCKTCAASIGQLVEILPGAASAGVALWIVPADDANDIALLVDGTPLTDHVLVLDPPSRRRLNPLTAAPFYLFVDEKMIARASNPLGDEDWRTFVAQMREAAAAPSS
jgi:hypothetical protein